MCCVYVLQVTILWSCRNSMRTWWWSSSCLSSPFHRSYRHEILREVFRWAVPAYVLFFICTAELWWFMRSFGPHTSSSLVGITFSISGKNNFGFGYSLIGTNRWNTFTFLSGNISGESTYNIRTNTQPHIYVCNQIRSAQYMRSHIQRSERIPIVCVPNYPNVCAQLLFNSNSFANTHYVFVHKQITPTTNSRMPTDNAILLSALATLTRPKYVHT